MFELTGYTSMVDVDNAFKSVTFLGGSCTVGYAISECHSKFFSGNAKGRSRALVAVIAGKAPGDVIIPADSLRMCGVKITVVGIGRLVDQSQLTSMAYPSSYILRIASIDGLLDISGSTTSLIAQGRSL